MNRRYLIMKSIIKHFISLHIIRHNYNVTNVINSIINNKYNSLNNIEKIVIMNDFTRGIPE